MVIFSNADIFDKTHIINLVSYCFGCFKSDFSIVTKFEPKFIDYASGFNLVGLRFQKFPDLVEFVDFLDFNQFALESPDFETFMVEENNDIYVLQGFLDSVVLGIIVNNVLYSFSKFVKLVRPDNIVETLKILDFLYSHNLELIHSIDLSYGNAILS